MLHSFQILGVEFHSYGVLLAVSITVGYVVFRHLCRLAGDDWDKIRIFTLLGIPISYLGTIVLEQIPRWPDFGPDRLSFWRILNAPGLTYYGVVVFGVPVFALSLRRARVAVLPVLDRLATVLPLGEAIGRVGCFLAGCCYGIPTDSWIGMCFRSPVLEPAAREIPRHPVQLYFVALNIVLLIGLWRIQRSPAFPGQALAAYLFGYGIGRFFLEYLRVDPHRLTWQGISVAGASLGVAIVLCCCRRGLSSEPKRGPM